ncbi:hypothetical protein So717_26680 [Roseobacter cerasinus]|uniref:Uncharacterized protein n=1 Tax=Roseobacter cerasinus TaxID=2602289 RepID=A0A640VVJ5_9RHOB|nr:hypothetical protein [Roseobacter cerasinus]GFE50915.1 hypothetical protein So717_26680 [Roseobacter cerasinus]
MAIETSFRLNQPNGNFNIFTDVADSLFRKQGNFSPLRRNAQLAV